jgi:hypothetical protein
MSEWVSDWTSVFLRCVSDSLYLSQDGSLGVVGTADGWQLVNAATGERMEPGVFYETPAHAAGAITRMIRTSALDGG